MKSARQYFTDYPIEGNADGAMVQVELLAYDRNKYITVKYKGEIDEVKSGYIYSDPAVLRSLTQKEVFALPQTLHARRPHKLHIAQELRKARITKVTYLLRLFDSGKALSTKLTPFKSRSDAIRAFIAELDKGLEGRCIFLSRKINNSRMSSIDDMLGVEEGEYFETGSRGRTGRVTRKDYIKIMKALIATKARLAKEA